MLPDELDISKIKEQFYATVENVAVFNKNRADKLEKIAEDVPTLHREVLKAIEATHLNTVALARSHLTIVLVVCILGYMALFTIVLYLTIPEFMHLVKTYVGEVYTWLMMFCGSVSLLLLRLNNSKLFKAMIKRATEYAEEESK